MRRKYFVGILIPFVTLLVQVSVGENVGNKCPTDLPGLGEMLGSNGWSLEDYQYKIQVKPFYYQDANGTLRDLNVASKCEIEIELTLRRKDHLNNSMSCTININSHKSEYSLPYRDLDPTVAGTLYVQNLHAPQTYRYYVVRGFFPIGNGTLSNFKVRYKISVLRPNSENYTVLSNMPNESTTQHSENWVWDHFQETIPMYPNQISVAVIGGEIKRLNKLDKDLNRTISVIWTNKVPTELSKDLEMDPFAFIRPTEPDEEITLEKINCIADRATKLVKYFKKKFGVAFPSPKLDIIATKNGILSSQRDKQYPGLLVYPDLVSDPCDEEHHVTDIMDQWTSFIRSQDADNVTSHFQDLKRGFVTYINWRSLDEFQYKNKLSPFQTMLLRVPPTCCWVFLKQSFFTTSVWKPVQFFKMLETVLTEPVLEAGIQNFMKRINNERESLDITEIFGPMQEAVENQNKTQLLPGNGVKLNDILENWMKIDGYPLIRVASFGNDPNVLLVIQEISPFIFETSPANSSSPKNFWIPLEIVTDSDKKLIWLSNETSYLTVTLDKPLTDTKFVLLNPNIGGYVRIMYDETLTNLLTKQLERNNSIFTRTNKLKLVLDHLIFPVLEKEPSNGLSSGLKFMEYLGKENDTTVWQVMGDYLKYFTSYGHFDHVTFAKIKNYFGSLIDSALESGSSSDHADLLRKEMIPLCIKFKTRTCVEQAKALMNNWKDNPKENPFEKLPHNPENGFQCLALNGTGTGSSAEIYNFYAEIVRKNVSDEAWNGTCGESKIDEIMKCTDNPEVIMPRLREVIKSNFNRSDCTSDTIRILSGATSPAMAKPLFELARENLLNRNLEPRAFFAVVYPIASSGREGKAVDLIDDYEAILLDNEKSNGTLFGDKQISSLLQHWVNHLKEIKQKGESKYAQSGLRWLEMNGY